MEGKEQAKARSVWKVHIGSSEVEYGGVCFGSVDQNLSRWREKERHTAKASSFTSFKPP